VSQVSTPAQTDVEERVVFINRTSKVVKGGRRFSFSAVVVVGDRNGRVGYGFGKANEVADAIRKAGDIARRGMIEVTMRGRTIPHPVTGSCDGGRVLLMPAVPGTGVIAGGGVRPVLDVAGVRDCMAKSMNSNNRLNVVKATFDALGKLRSKKEITAARRGASASV
jgi:small subunit ribosomal protein S5